MPLDPQNTINSPLGLSIALLIGRYTPNRIGHLMVNFAADYLSSRKGWKMVQSVRLNQWVVYGENLNQAALDDAVYKNFRSTARSIFDLYHNINNPKVFRHIIDVHPIAEQLLTRPEYAERGLVVAGIHMSNFDFIGQAAGMAGVKAMFLGLPEMHAGYQKQLEMRRQRGMNIIPTNSSTIKQALKYLRDGGMVITGIDRPDESYPYRPLFFGRPAALPIHHIFLALKAQVPVLVGSVIWKPDGKYHFLFSESIEMQPYPDRHLEITRNAERVLHIAEDFIRQDPSQWSMTFPVWPDAMDKVPL
jgi:phosphatidylinositol dimannoside acyltransferase